MADKKIDPFDVEALEKSVNDSATRVSAIWISFLIFGLYLVIAAGTVTHRQLLLEDPIKLPVLNVELSLLGFFFLAPILFVIFHAYVLLQVLLLGRTSAAYNEALKRAHLEAEENASIRQRLANTLFAQIFAGSPRERDGLLGLLLKAMARITLAIAPVLILLSCQFQFLPYQSRWVTSAYRIFILVDLAIILVLWPVARDPGHEVTLQGFFQQWVALPIAIVTAAFSWIVLSFPGEPVAEWARYWPSEESRSNAPKLGDGLQCRTRSLVSWVFPSFDRLHLPRVDVVDDEALKKVEEHTKTAGEYDYQGERTRLLRNREFNCADFSDHADLRRVDLNGASLRGASFVGSKLQGASLESAQLQGASLESAQLQGADLQGAQLQGASLVNAQLQGASLQHAELQGASLNNAQLQGASLYNAQLQGAVLVWAKLGGASLESAQLQGAELDYAALTEAVFLNAAVWRAQNTNTDCSAARVQRTKYDPVIQFQTVLEKPNLTKGGTNYIFVPSSGAPTPKATAQFIQIAVTGISDPMKGWIIHRLQDHLLVDATKDAKIENGWRACEESSGKVSEAEFDKKHAAFLRDLVCDATRSRAAIAKGIIRNWISGDEDRQDFSAQLARGLLGEDGEFCAATKDLDDSDIERLRAAELARRTTMSAPAPSP